MAEIVVLNSELVTGGTIITVAAVFSLFGLLLTLLHIFLASVLPAYAQRMSSPQERKFLMSPLGLYLICLFTSNFISTVGGVMQTRWLRAGAITQGPACTFQALLLQLGNNSTALWIGVISVSALRTFMFRARSLSRMATLLLICALWTAMILFDTLASTLFTDRSGKFFYGIAFTWCWITPSYRTARLVTQYVWMWIWSLVSAMCFVLVFLSVRGNITVKRAGLGRSVKWSKRAFHPYAAGREHVRYGTLVGTVGKTMCWLPICYITLTLPISVSRILETFGFPIPVYAFVFSAVCFLLLGISFPILYLAICHSLKYASGEVSPSSTLCEVFGKTLDAKSFHTQKGNRLSSTGESPPPPHHQRTSEGTSPSSTITNGEEEDIFPFRRSKAPLPRISVSFQPPPRAARSYHHPMNSTSTVSQVQLPPALGGELGTQSIKSQRSPPQVALVLPRQSPPKIDVGFRSDLEKNDPSSPSLDPAHKRSDTYAFAYTGPRAISPDLNVLFVASQTPKSPSGLPPPPRKIRRIPVPSVPADVDESDQGSILSALPSTVVFNPRDIQPVPQRSPDSIDSMRTFWAAYENETPMTPSIPFPVDVASMRDTIHGNWTTYEDPSPTTANFPISPDIASPDSPQFHCLDPSISLRPAISAVGLARMNISQMVLSKDISNHQPLRSSTTIQAPPLAVLHSDTTRLRSSYSTTAPFSGSYAWKPTVSKASNDLGYRTPRFQTGYI